MHGRLTRGLGVIMAIAAAGAAWAQGPSPALKPGEGAQTVQAVCTRCHTIGVVIAHPHGADEWNDIIGKMIDKGLVASDDQLDQIAAYLAKNYAPAPNPDGGPAAPTGPSNAR